MQHVPEWLCLGSQRASQGLCEFAKCLQVGRLSTGTGRMRGRIVCYKNICVLAPFDDGQQQQFGSKVIVPGFYFFKLTTITIAKRLNGVRRFNTVQDLEKGLELPLYLVQKDGLFEMLNRGSEWHRWEPHIHAPGTAMNNQFTGPNAWNDYLKALEAATPKIEAIAVTD